MKTKLLHVLVLAGLGLSTQVAIAGESGKFVGHSALVATKFNEFKAPEGHPYKAAISGELDGVLFYSGGGGKLDQLLDRSHYIVQWVGDAGTGTSYCMKTFTTSAGDKLFARCDGQNNPNGSTGTVTLLGGTGPFAGIKGKGKFNFVVVTERVFWDDIEWEWEKP
jgi:hypothetical protein